MAWLACHIGGAPLIMLEEGKGGAEMAWMHAVACQDNISAELPLL
jgi:hypothetical protein